MDGQVNMARSVGMGLVLGLVLAAGAPAALGQNALGSGQGLYRDLQQHNSLAAQGRDYAAEARNRNSVVFGRAPGGLSFRGGLGYRDPAEFLGTLGSDTLHSFNASAAMSGLAALNIRSTQALDQQRALSIGAPSRSGFTGTLDTPRIRSSTGADLNPTYRRATGSFRVDPLGERRDESRRPGNVLSTAMPIIGAGGEGSGGSSRGAGLAANSAFSTGLTSRAAQTSEYGAGLYDRLGVSRRLGGKVSEITEADPTYGTDTLGGDRTLAGTDRSRRGQEKQSADSAKSRMFAVNARPGDLLDNRSAVAGPDLRAKPQAPELMTPYDVLKSNLDKQMGPVGAPETKTTDRTGTGSSELSRKTRPDWEDRIDKLKSTLRMDPERAGAGATLMGKSVTESALAGARAGKKGEAGKKPKSTEIKLPERFVDQGKEGQEGKQGAEGEVPNAWLDARTLKLIREAAIKVDELAPIGAPTTRDFFVEHMKIGQLLLGQGRFFDAEDRFARALAVKPGDVTAQVGRIHSELGAGLTLSAGQNLRKLLASHPEAAGMRYSAKLLPSGERADAIVEQLRENLGGQGTLRRESALLMAYMGFQMQQIETTRAGVNAIAAVAGQDPEAMSAGDARLAEFLRGLWLDPTLYESKDAPIPGK